MRTHLLALSLTALAISCADLEDSPITDDTTLGVATVQPGFAFYPPWGVLPAAQTQWSPEALPHLVVSIDETDTATGRIRRNIRRFTSTSSPRRLNRYEQYEAYAIDWDVANDTLTDGTTIRATITADGVELGRSDIPPAHIAHLRTRQSFWLKFRVERDAVDADLDGVLDWDDHCPELPDPANPIPQPEICDGLDNDCSGAVDDDVLGVDQACATSQHGACQAGRTSCRDGGLVCIATLAPSAESCDGIDNDCDGTIDDGASATCAAPSNGYGTCTHGRCVQSCNAGYQLMGNACVLMHGNANYNYTGAAQTFTVPAGIYAVQIDMAGAQGGNGQSTTAAQSVGGYGARVTATLNVTPGEVLQINVGGAGTIAGAGGWNGGGASTRGTYGTNRVGGGGGGASDIRRGGYASGDRVAVAGGGGGGGGGSAGSRQNAGGGGGATDGVAGSPSSCANYGGGGGTLSSAGVAGSTRCSWALNGIAGNTSGVGGDGRGTNSAQGNVGGGTQGGGGGGGGGGRTGGGGGAGDGVGNSGGSGGGGGSSSVNAGAGTAIVYTASARSGHGYVNISW